MREHGGKMYEASDKLIKAEVSENNGRIKNVRSFKIEGRIESWLHA